MPGITETWKELHGCYAWYDFLHASLSFSRMTSFWGASAMTAAQTRLADTIDIFYGAADKTSEGAMAAHAYKRAVDDLDTGIARELVHVRPTLLHLLTPPSLTTTRFHSDFSLVIVVRMHPTERQ